MHMLTLIPPTDPLLNQRSSEVSAEEISSPEIQNLIDRMYDLALGERREFKRPFLVGLAAPQIGVLKRIILVDSSANGFVLPDTVAQEVDAYINPVIVWRSEELVLWREGCYSTDRICGVVPRSYEIHLRALDRNGNPVAKKATGYTARIFQHEIDHLDGIRFPDRVANDTLLQWVPEDEIVQYRKTWPIWERLCPRETWTSMKEGKPYRIPD